jgi:hypothetical protein
MFIPKNFIGSMQPAPFSISLTHCSQTAQSFGSEARSFVFLSNLNQKEKDSSDTVILNYKKYFLSVIKFEGLTCVWLWLSRQKCTQLAFYRTLQTVRYMFLNSLCWTIILQELKLDCNLTRLNHALCNGLLP